MKQYWVFLLILSALGVVAAAPFLPTSTPDPYPGPTPTPIGTPTRTPPPTAYPVPPTSVPYTPHPVTPPSTPACYPYCPPPTGVDLTTIEAGKPAWPWLLILVAAAVLLAVGLIHYKTPR
ncbi:MAG: hypothetical protein IPL78_04655 [Chloroflexi bacterium]|nr:hypothetical protein [Chloroflexota bacterium]